MKCLSCGNLIPDASTVCPYCNSKVDPVVSVAPVYADNSLTSAPTTPVTPDLPVAQPGMVAPVQSEAPVAPVEAPVTPVAPVTPEVAPVVPETPVQPVLPQDQGMVVGTPAPAVQPVVAPETPVAPVAPTPVVESAPVVEPIVPAPAPTTAMVNQGVTPPPFGGEKIASTIDAPKKKISKGALIGIIVAVVVVLAGIGVGVFYYMSQYKSADKRLDTIINTVFKDLVSIKNEEIELGSGSYELSASISSNDSTVSTKLNGMYAIDINNKIADYTLNVESLQFGQELLDAGELNFEVYAEGNRVYFLLQNFYDKYIYVDTEGVFVEEENDKGEKIEIDYQKLVIALRDAVKASFRAANKTQTVGEVKIDGKATTANIIEINFNEANVKIMVKALQNSLANNKVFITEIAKISGKTEEEVKESILGIDEEEKDEVSDLDTLSKTTTVLKIYTAMFGDELLGADLTVNTVYDKNHEYYDAELYKDTKFVVNVFNRGQTLVTVVTSNDEKLIEFSIEEGYEKNSTEEINSVKVNLSISDKENGATTIKLEGKYVSHLQPKVDKVVVKNVINAEDMTDADLQGILDKIEGYGTLGVLLQSMFGDLTTDLLNPYDTMKENMMCSSATNCIDNGDGTSTCQACADENCTTTNTITCPTLEEDYDFDSEF